MKGLVMDEESSAPLTPVTIRVMKGREIVSIARTDFDGLFEIHNIPVDQYDVLIDCSGYRDIRFENVHVKAGKMLEKEGGIRMTYEEFTE